MANKHMKILKNNFKKITFHETNKTLVFFLTRSTFIFMNQQVIFIKYIFNSTHFCYKLVRKKTIFKL